ncbi:MAG TPA: aldo/keto reductase [Cellvibrio sp.]|nr:aldo/keto reductase [Cellvibrio sp.]
MLRKIGNTNLPAVGLGCMGMSEFYGETNDAESLLTLQEAYELGYRHFDTADMYGIGHNETLLGKFISGKLINRDNIFLATKGGIVRDKTDKFSISVNTRPDYIRAACEASLQRLQTDYIDLYYLHRLDPNIPLNETLGVLADLVAEGKIRNIGLCEVSAEQLQAAHNIHPIAALQSELSLWTRDAEGKILPLCEELGIAFVAFSPLGRGFLTGGIDKSFMDSASNELDFRKKIPRFSAENIGANLDLVKRVETIAQSLDLTTSKLALAWVLARSPNVHIIPGSKTRKYLAANFNAQHAHLEQSVLQELDKIFSPEAVMGSRYPQKILAHSNA